jgi:hypothetical protein
VSQVAAANEKEAVRAWAVNLRVERPFARASAFLAKSVEINLDSFPPVSINGVANVWCITGSCGGDFMLADIVETVPSINGR